MQKLEVTKNPGETTVSRKITKKGKVAGSSKNTAEINSQFAEIFGQISLALPPTKVAIPKQTEAVVNTAKAAEASAESVGKTNQSSKTAPGKTEVGITGTISNQSVKMLPKKGGSENIEVKIAQSDTNQVNGSNSEISSSACITGSKASGVAKSGRTSTIGEMYSTADSNPSKAAASSEIKIADLMLASNVSQTEKTALRMPDKKMPPQQEVFTSSISSASISNDIVASSKESAKSNHQGAGSDSGETRTSVTKPELAAANGLIGEKGVVEFEVAGFDGSNIEKTMFSKSQTDFLVNKMIEQIKVAPSSLEVSLKPEYLGKINILVQSVAGTISVNVIAQNSEALNLVNSNLQNIKDNLVQYGIDVQQLEVNLSNQEQQNNRNSHEFSGQSQTFRLVERTNRLDDYGSLADLERSSFLSSRLNLLA